MTRHRGIISNFGIMKKSWRDPKTMLTLKQFRARYHITQKELAQKVGVTPTTLSKYEHGEWLINQAVIDKIKELYGVDIRPKKSRKKIWGRKEPH